MTTALPVPLPRVRPLQPWIWRAQDVLVGYLPILLMALLAAATWWLVKNTPSAETASEKPPARHVPDYRMTNFEIQRIGPNGLLRVHVEGAELRHFPDTDTIEIDQARMRAYAPDGSVTVAEAQRAVSNADGSEMQFMGGVKLRRLPAESKAGPKAVPVFEVEGEFLHAFAFSETMRSHLPVTIRHGSGLLHAKGFEYRHLSGQMDFTGKSEGRFEPRGRAATAAAATKVRR
jgi:lipopolysaccharide export system protein LptC